MHNEQNSSRFPTNLNESIIGPYAIREARHVRIRHVVRPLVHRGQRVLVVTSALAVGGAQSSRMVHLAVVLFRQSGPVALRVLLVVVVRAQHYFAMPAHFQEAFCVLAFVASRDLATMGVIDVVVARQMCRIQRVARLTLVCLDSSSSIAVGRTCRARRCADM